MPLDPNIILQAQPIQFANPLDAATKAMNLKQLAQQNQLVSQKIADDQAVRSAFQSGVTIGPDGKPSLNRDSTLASLYKADPLKAMDVQQQFRQQDAADQAAQREKAKNLIWSIKDNDPQGYEVARQSAIKQGLQNADKWPLQYDPHLVNNMKLASLTAEEQLGQQNKQTEFGLKREDLAARRREQENNKQSQMFNSTRTLLESMRGNPAVQKAENDIYASAKANSLVNLYGDPNKLSPQMAKLLYQEVGKIASGGTPTQHELDGLDAGALKGQLAGIWQKFSNNPSPANAGAFIKQYQDYAGAVTKDAQKVIEDRYGRIIDTGRKYIGEDNYKNLQDQYVNRFKNASPDSASPNFDNMSDKDLFDAYKKAGGN